MRDDAALVRFEALANESLLNELELWYLAQRIGSDIRGLRTLVDRYADSSNPVLVRYTALSVGKAPWEWERVDEQLRDTVLDFISVAGLTADFSTLSSCKNALLGLLSRQLLIARSEADKIMLGEFVLHSLEHPNVIVRAGCIDLMAHLKVDNILNGLLTTQGASALRDRLNRLEADEGEEFRDDLSDLRDWYSP